MQDIIKLQGDKKGKTTVIMTGVHGNEKSGLEAFNKILLNLKIISGTVYFIIANPKAVQKNVRFIKKNMNRCFLKKITGKSYEEKRAREIRKYLKNADYLLDIHNTINRGSETFLIGEEKEMAKYFPVQKLLLGIDKIQKGGSDGYMHNIGKIGFCIECGSIYDKKGSDIAYQSIINFLKLIGNIEGKPKVFFKKQNYIYCKKNYLSKTNKFLLAKKFRDFENIKKGELIGIDGEKEVRAKEDGTIIFAHNADSKGKECFIFGTYIK